MIRLCFTTSIPLLFALACDSGPSDTDAGTGDDTDTEEDFDTGPNGPDRTETSGSCTPDVDACEEGDFRELALYSEYAQRNQQPGPYTETLTTAGEWETWWQGNGRGDERPAVDFETEVVLISGYSTNASCGLTLDDVRVTDCGGVVRLTTATTDTSGTCTATCDSEDGTLVAVAISAGTTEVCAQVDLTCR